MERSATLLITIILVAHIVGPKVSPVRGVAWGSTGSLPGSDQYQNTFPKLLQSNNGSVWMVWEKVLNGYGQIYLMVNNGFGWSGEIPLINNNGAFDDVAPALTQLPNGTIILAWSRGEGGTGACFSKTYSIYTESYSNGQWSTPSVLVQGSGSGDNLTPAMAELKDGRVMIVWSKCNSTNGRGDLYYKMSNGTIWSTESLLVGSTTYEEKLPGITQAADGQVWVVYTANTASGNVNQLWDVVWNGSSWTSPAMFTNSTTDDDWPAIAQDRNQTLWVFWARDLSNGTQNGQPSFQYDLFYKNSTNNGQTWSPEQTIAPNINSDDKQPFVMQAANKKLWMVYSSNQRLGNPFKTFNLYMIASDVVKIHDVSIVSVLPPPITSKFSRIGDTVNMTVSVSNRGDYTEFPMLNCYANTTRIYGASIPLTAGQTNTLTIPWNTTGTMAGTYLFRATIPAVTGEFLTSNNSFNNTTPFPLSFRGDVNRHGRVDITDLSTVAAHFGSALGSVSYTNIGDLNHDNKIDIVDLAIVGIDFGKVLVIHDLAVLSITRPSITPRFGELVKVNVTISNLGGFTESSQATLSLNSTIVATVPVTITSGQTLTITFSWNSTGQVPGRYTMSIAISPVAGEVVTSNNSLNSTLTITFRGDVNRDLKVDISDMALVAGHFGAIQGTPSYIAAADLNHDGVIDITDMAIVGADFGKTIT